MRAMKIKTNETLEVLPLALLWSILLAVCSEAFQAKQHNHGLTQQRATQSQCILRPTSFLHVLLQNPSTVEPTLSEIPKPFDWPIVGTFPDFQARGGVDALSEVHESMYKDYGEIYKLNLIGTEMIVVSDPNVWGQALRKEGIYPVGGSESATPFKDYYTENEIRIAQKSVSRGPEWREWRLGSNPDLYVLWDTYLPTIGHVCSKISKVAGREVTEEKNTSFSEFLSRSAFDMFSAVLFGESVYTTDSRTASKEDVEFLKATQAAFDITGALISNPLEKLFGSELYKRFVVNMDKTFAYGSSRSRDLALDALTNKEQQAESEGDDSNASGCPVSAVRSKFQSPKALNRDKTIPTDFLNPSFVERSVDRGLFSVQEISEMSGLLLMAGVDTTTYAMNWFFLNMASNPDIQTKLAKELQQTLGGADVTTVDQLNSLTYLNACFRESHRLTPTNSIMPKTLEKDIDLVIENDYGPSRAFRVEAGKMIGLNLKGLPVDPKYVPTPDKFIPERFSPEAIEARKGTPSEIALDHVYFQDPFGAGKRRCLGANIAKAEMMVFAARLLQDWEITLEDPSSAKEWKAKQKLMLKADPYPAMRLTPRTL